MGGPAELATADGEAARQTEAAELRIRAIRTKAMDNIESVASEAAQAAVELLTGKKLTPKTTLAAVKKALN